jgi:hypothetical protein
MTTFELREDDHYTYIVVKESKVRTLSGQFYSWLYRNGIKYHLSLGFMDQRAYIQIPNPKDAMFFKLTWM